jgi:hypothetical protein
MRLTIIHDENGSIVSLLAAPPDGPPASLEPAVGQITTDVDASPLALPRDAVKLADQLKEIAKHYLVERPTREGESGKLTRRSTAG